MKKVSAFPVEHRGLKRILLRFDFDEKINKAIRKVPDMRWSSTLKGWHMPDTSESCNRLRDELSDIAVLELMNADGKPEVIMKAGFAAGIERDAVDSFVLSDFVNKEEVHEEKVSLTAEDEKVLKEFLRWMEYTRYSESARRTYLKMMRLFLEFIKPKEMMDVNEEDILAFSRDYVIERGYSLSFQNQAISAIKLFYRMFKGVKMSTAGINRPRSEHRLPNVLSREEVKRIINAPINEKHRVMLSLIYACGLRRCELLALKYGDIERDRGLLSIRLSKGNKDRIVPISPRMISIIDAYYVRYKPQKWLFEGINKGDRYSESSLEKVLKMACEKAGVEKPVTLHWLRHSYATHLLESGTDLRYIQELLGHKSSRTTEIYTHVTIQSIQKIRSPFDDLDNE